MGESAAPRQGGGGRRKVTITRMRAISRPCEAHGGRPIVGRVSALAVAVSGGYGGAKQSREETAMNFSAEQAQAFWNDWGQPTLIAAIILVAAHFIAKAVRWAIVQGIKRLPVVGSKDAAGVKESSTVAERLGDVGYWLVWLLGLIGALSRFGWLSPVVQPLTDMVTGFLTYVRYVVAAAVIFSLGFVLATIVRRMVEAAVQAVELDKRLIDAGLTNTPRGPDLARLLGVLVFTLIIIPVSIAALQALKIDAISTPAISMLALIFDAIPRVIAAGLIVFIAYLIGRWVGFLAEGGLRSIGFDGIIRSISAAEPIKRGMDQSDLTPGVDTFQLEESGYPPSRLVGIAVLIGIVLFSSVEAARLLGFGAMAQMLGEVLELASRVLFGAIIIAVGVLIANILAAAASRGGKASAEVFSVLVRWGVIALAAAVGLRFMGLANDIITLAFGLVLGAAAVAVAIAFGVGGRDAAKRALERWTSAK
jgi:Mechanosensitive ion channel, conserved TM helix